jgi:hypothetical protein
MNDSQLIDALGGPAKLAALLGYDKEAGGTQRVHNWRTRGIPAKVKLAHPAIFDAARAAAKAAAAVKQPEMKAA